MKSTSIYMGWKRDILSLMVPNLDPWFGWKVSNRWFKSLPEKVGC
jgi:hypothetical protein